MRITYSILDMPVLFIMLMSELACRTATLHIMPPFTPNDAMLNLHKDKGKEDWEIYAWCVQDIIAKKGGLKKAEYASVTNKLKYGKRMLGESMLT